MFLNQVENHLELFVLTQMRHLAGDFQGHLLHGLQFCSDDLLFFPYCQKHIQLQLTVQNSRNIYNPCQKHSEKSFSVETRNPCLWFALSQQQLMYNKNEEEGDYLESLFIKPFCERYCEQSTPQKNGSFVENEDESKPTRRLTCHLYNPIHEQQVVVVRKMSANDNRIKYNQKNNQSKPHMTPYLSRKNQQKGFAKQLRKQLLKKDRQLPLSLQSTQQNWLIIREVQSKLVKIRQAHNKDQIFSNESYLKEQASQPRHTTIKNQFQQLNIREDTKNIKTMMSYYKNKRQIKHMAKMNGPINLTNSQIQQSINLRVENTSAIKTQSKDKTATQNNRSGQSTKRKLYIREKGVKTQHSSIFKDPLKRRIVRLMTSNSSSMSSIQLKDYLRSSKIDMPTKKLRPKTEIRLKRPQNISPSKTLKRVNTSTRNQVCAWQNSSQKHESDTLLLI